MAWIDYAKAYGSIPHTWIVKCLRMYKIDNKVVRYRDKKMGLLAQFSTTFTSHLICTQQPYCSKTNFPIELYQAVWKASSGAKIWC